MFKFEEEAATVYVGGIAPAVTEADVLAVQAKWADAIKRISAEHKKEADPAKALGQKSKIVGSKFKGLYKGEMKERTQIYVSSGWGRPGLRVGAQGPMAFSIQTGPP